MRLLDLDQDHLLDVVIGNEHVQKTRVWSATMGQWTDSDFPVALIKSDDAGNRRDACARFGVVRPDSVASVLVAEGTRRNAWTFREGKWTSDDALLAGLSIVPPGGAAKDAAPIDTGSAGRDRGVRLRDLDRDGVCELIVANGSQQEILGFDAEQNGWHRLPFVLPEAQRLSTPRGAMPVSLRRRRRGRL